MISNKTNIGLSDFHSFFKRSFDDDSFLDFSSVIGINKMDFRVQKFACHMQKM